MLEIQTRMLSEDRIRKLVAWLRLPDAVIFRNQLRDTAVELKIKIADLALEVRKGSEPDEFNGEVERLAMLGAMLDVVDQMEKGEFPYIEVELNKLNE